MITLKFWAGFSISLMFSIGFPFTNNKWQFSQCVSKIAYPRLVIEPVLEVWTNIFRQKIEVAIRIGNIPVPFNQEFGVSRTTLELLPGARM